MTPVDDPKGYFKNGDESTAPHALCLTVILSPSSFIEAKPRRAHAILFEDLKV